VPDVEVVDDVVAAVLPDVVKDARQDPAVHQMAGDFDALAHTHGADTSAAGVLADTGLAQMREPSSQGSRGVRDMVATR
jgi:hypothetical protein